MYSLDLSDSARLFAMLDLSAADALITAWSDKYYFNFWRPWAAIRQADTDGNPATVADPGWKPMFDSSLDPAIGGVGPPLGPPPYPDHPSGATSYASASMNAFAAFFGTDELPFFATSSRFPGEQRAFTRFSGVTDEVLEARIWAGIHFRTPGRPGRRASAARSRGTSTSTGSRPRTEPRKRGAAFGPLHVTRCRCAAHVAARAML